MEERKEPDYERIIKYAQKTLDEKIVELKELEEEGDTEGYESLLQQIKFCCWVRDSITFREYLLLAYIRFGHHRIGELLRVFGKDADSFQRFLELSGKEYVEVL